MGGPGIKLPMLRYSSTPAGGGCLVHVDGSPGLGDGLVTSEAGDAVSEVEADPPEDSTDGTTEPPPRTVAAVAPELAAAGAVVTIGGDAS
jgi:hypothetical protein